jgi:hypothetical protein
MIHHVNDKVDNKDTGRERGTTLAVSKELWMCSEWEINAIFSIAQW